MYALRSRRAAAAIAVLSILPVALIGCGGMVSGGDFQNPQVNSAPLEAITRINDGTSNTRRGAETEEATAPR